MAFRAVQAVPEAREVAEQQLLPQGDKSEFSDDALLDFKYVRAFLELAPACSAFFVVGHHCHAEKKWLIKVEPILRSSGSRVIKQDTRATENKGMPSDGSMAERRDQMDSRMHAISNDLNTQWQDHFHMRDQTWKVLQYTILFFLGVVGLEIKQIDKTFLIPAYLAVVVTGVFGLCVAIHHRRRQHEKFQIIVIYERELGLYELIQPVLDRAHTTFTGRMDTGKYIGVMQFAVALVAVLLLARIALS